MDNKRLLKVRVIRDDGESVEMEILFTFSNDELRKDYIAVTDWTYNDDNELNVYVYSYATDENGITKYTAIKDKDELGMAEEILDECRAIYENDKKHKEGLI